MSGAVDPTLAVVVVSYQSTDVLAEFLASLEESSVVPSQVVIVDNSPEVMAIPGSKTLPKISVIHRPDNPGYGSAVNIGVRSLPVECEWVVICNPDIVVHPDTLESLLSVARSIPEAAALGPAISNEDGSLYPSARALPTLGVGIGHALLGIVWPTNPWTIAYRGDYLSENVRESGWLSGSFQLMRRKALDKVSGFDDGYFMFFEDVDLGWRLGEAGYRNLYVPHARATHVGGHSTKQSQKAMIRAHHDSAMRFITKRYPGALWWPLRALIGLGLSVRERILRSRALEA
jgi:N-acetylglucosaminyl-diphospho-decaprenol L-rhamnosyltransferase